MEVIMNTIKSIRNIRAEMNVIPSKKAKVIIIADSNIHDTIEKNKEYIISLANASEVEFKEDKTDIPEDAISSVINGAEIFMPLDELVDFDKELERLNKEKDRLEQEIDRVNKKLSNKGFISKAPEKLVKEEEQKKVKYEDMYNKVVERISVTEKKLK